MSVKIGGLSGRSVNRTSDGNKSGGVKKTQSGASSAIQGSRASGGDTVSLTGTATRMQELEAHIASLPIADFQRVSDVQLSLSSGSFQPEPIDSATSLLTQEREFALLDKKR